MPSSARSLGDTDHDKVLEEASRDPNVTAIYGNGFIVGRTNADVMIVILRNGVPSGVWNLSYTLAKTLGERLGRMIADLEESTSHSIMTVDRITGTMADKEGELNEPSEG